MKFFLLFLTFCLAGPLVAQPQKAASKPDPKPKTTLKRHPDGRNLGIPYSAVRTSEATWRGMENGKVVIYRTTAFGYAKLTEEENAKIQRMIDGKPDQSAEIREGLSVEERDGKLHFSRVSPFGDFKYIKDKTDLTPSEKALWERTQAKGETKK
jgi:hypothetical protein